MLLLLSIIGIIICFYYDNYINMMGHNFENIILFLLGSFCGIYIVLFFSNVLKKLKVISFIGQNSIIILCCHEPIRRMVIKLFSLLFNINISILRGSIIYSTLMTLLIIVVTIPIIFVINKFFPFCIGKTKK